MLAPATKPQRAPVPFGERLVQLGKIKPADLERALRAQTEIHQPLGSNTRKRHCLTLTWLARSVI